MYTVAAFCIAAVGFNLPSSTAALALFVVAMLSLGAGNGAVFQLVPQRFNKEIGVMTGLVGMAGGIFSSFFSGEGLVTRIKGPGRIYMQSRSTSGLTGWINSHLW